MLPRVAVLGCGYWGKNHIHTLKELGVLAAVSDINTIRAQEISKQYNVVAISYEMLFQKLDIDAIVIALPPQFHAKNAILSITNGKDVFVEKPIALNLEDAKKIVKKAKDYKKIFMSGHILRFHLAFEKLLSLIEEKILGDIRYIHASRLSFKRSNVQSDALWDLASHDLSMILALTKEDPDFVRIENSPIVNNFSDFSLLYMRFRSLCAHLVVSHLNPYQDRKLTIIGTKGMAIFNDMQCWNRKLAIYCFDNLKDFHKNEFSFERFKYLSIRKHFPLKRELEHFIKCIQTRKEPRTNGKEAISVIKILTGNYNKNIIKF